MRADRKQTILFVIILLILSMGIGYAFLTTTLNIDGVSDIDSASWDIHWDNVQVQNGSVTGSQVISPATIGNYGTSVNYSIKLSEPGDYYYFCIDAVNEGTLDAMIESIDIDVNGSGNNLPPYLLTKLFYLGPYSTFYALNVGQELYSGDIVTYCFGILYDPNVSVNNLPTVDETINITIDITYSQLISGLNHNNKYIYTSDPKNFHYLGKGLPNNGIYFNDYSSTLGFNNFSFLRLYVDNKKISSLDVGFVYNNNVFYLRGGDNGDSYESNKAVALAAFGSSMCEERSLPTNCDFYPDCPTYLDFYCLIDNYGNYYVDFTDYGEVIAIKLTKACYISPYDNTAYCYDMGGL